MPRYHLSFEYKHPARTYSNSGDQVVIADSLNDAIRWIAQARGLTTLHVRKRHFLGKPASESEIIDQTWVEDGAP